MARCKAGNRSYKTTAEQTKCPAKLAKPGKARQSWHEQAPLPPSGCGPDQPVPHQAGVRGPSGQQQERATANAPSRRLDGRACFARAVDACSAGGVQAGCSANVTSMSAAADMRPAQRVRQRRPPAGSAAMLHRQEAAAGVQHDIARITIERDPQTAFVAAPRP